MAYGICRYEKRHKTDVSGIQRENNRESRRACTNNTDWDRTGENVALMYSGNWHRSINEILKNAGVKARKNSVVMMDTIYSASPEFFENRDRNEIVDYFRDCLKWHEEHLRIVFSAIIHFDEDTPHMHVQSVPIVEKDNGKKALSAKILQGYRLKMRQTQMSFYESVSRNWGLQEPEHRLTNQEIRKHRDTHEYNAQKAAERAREAENRAEKMEERLHDLERTVNELETAKGQKQDLVKAVQETRSQIAADSFELKALQDEEARIRKNRKKAEANKDAAISDLRNAISKVEEIAKIAQEIRNEMNVISYQNYPNENIVLFECANGDRYRVTYDDLLGVLQARDIMQEIPERLQELGLEPDQEWEPGD